MNFQFWAVLGSAAEKEKNTNYRKGPFKYYVSKKVGDWGQKMVTFADLQYYLC